MPKQHFPWTGRPEVRLHGTPRTPRVKDLIDCAFVVIRDSAPHSTPTTEAIDGWLVDVSQAIQRKPWSKRLTLTQNSQLYSFTHDACLSGCGNLQLMGWPRSVAPPSRFTEGDLRALAGEGYSLPWAAMIHYVMWANPFGPWWRESED